MKKIETYPNQTLYIGNDFQADIGTLFQDRLNSKSLLLVTGNRSFVNSTFYNSLLNFFESNNVTVTNTIHSGSNPKAENILAAVTELNKPDIILAVGGGSVIDSAKKVKAEYFRDSDFYAIYSRYGSATVVTPFYVFDNEEFKIGEMSEEAIPSVVYASTQLMGTLTQSQKTAGLADILAHATESHISTLSDETQKLTTINIVTKLHKGTVSKSLELNEIIQLDISAGLVESKSLVLLPHAIGHYLTYKLGIEHGIASIVSLKSFLLFLKDKNIDLNNDLHSNAAETSEMLLAEYADYNAPNTKEFLLKNIDDSFSLITKYMPFVFDLCPTPISKDDYVSIINNL